MVCPVVPVFRRTFPGRPFVRPIRQASASAAAASVSSLPFFLSGPTVTGAECAAHRCACSQPCRVLVWRMACRSPLSCSRSDTSRHGHWATPVAVRYSGAAAVAITPIVTFLMIDCMQYSAMWMTHAHGVSCRVYGGYRLPCATLFAETSHRRCFLQRGPVAWCQVGKGRGQVDYLPAVVLAVPSRPLFVTVWRPLRQQATAPLANPGQIRRSAACRFAALNNNRQPLRPTLGTRNTWA